MSGFDCLSKEEMHSHLLCTVLHYNSSWYKSVIICSMLEHLSIEKEELVESTKKFVFLSLEKHLHIALDTTNSEHLIPGILGHVYSGVRQHLELNHMKRAQSPQNKMYKDVRAKYLDGAKSILQNLPMPVPSIKTLFPATDKAISLAHIPANQILNHFLALGYDCYFYCAGFD